MGTPSFTEAIEARDAAMKQVEAGAGVAFADAAREFVVAYLARNGAVSSETLTDAAVASGIKPKNTTRAFGPVYASLARQGVIEIVGRVRRRKGHATTGGNVWQLAQKNTIWALTIDNEFNLTTRLFKTRDDAVRSAAQYCQEWWGDTALSEADDGETVPSDNEEIVRLYFNDERISGRERLDISAFNAETFTAIERN